MGEVLSGLVPTAPVRFAVDTGGQIFGVNGVDPPFVWDGVSSSAVRNWGIAAPPAPSAGATSGTGLTGVYYWQITWYNSTSGEWGEPLALALGPITLANQGYTVNRPSTAGIDSQITHWRLWRTTAGQATTFYLQGTYTIATASTTDSTSDTVLSSSSSLMDFSFLNQTGLRYRPDASKPFMAFFKGRFILFGARIEKTGTIALTNGATGVTGTSTLFRQSHVGQRLYVDGESVYYTIATVTNSTTATLSANYAGGTGGGKTFRIVPVRPSDVAWSQAGSESFAPLCSTGVFPADGDFPTGVSIVGTSLILWKKSHAYLFDYGSNPDPVVGSGNLSLVLSNRGIVRQECCVSVGLSAFCLDMQGIYEFDGAGQESVIDQGIRRLFQPDDEIPAAYQIARAYADTWHGCYDQRTDSVMFFVTTGTETKPQTALVWNRERQQWTMHKYQQQVLSSCQGRDANGEFRGWIGDANKYIWALAGTRQCEGVSTGTVSGTATAAAAGTLTDGTATFNTAGNALKGVYVTIVSGTGAGQSRLISSNTGTVLTITPNWSVTPDTTSQYVVGAVESTWRSVWHFVDPAPDISIKSVEFFFEPGTAPRAFRARFYKDFEANPITTWIPLGAKDGRTIPSTVASDGWITLDGSKATGRILVSFPVPIATCFSVELSMIANGKPILVRGYDIKGAAVPEEFP